MFPLGLPSVKNEKDTEDAAATEAATIHIVSSDSSDEETDVAQRVPPLPVPAFRRHRIMSSTLLSSENTSSIPLFDDLSVLSSSDAPTISTGTMKLLGPIIEAALFEEEQSNCNALVPYVPRYIWLATVLNVRDPDAADANQLTLVPYIGPYHRSFETPPREVRLNANALPSTPKKCDPDTMLLDIQHAIRRLTLQETNGQNGENVMSETNYEDITSPENFDVE